jgi:ribosomal protein L7/L12
MAQTILLLLLLVVVVPLAVVLGGRRRPVELVKPPADPVSRDELHRQVADLLRQRRKIQAVKLVREQTGLGLAEAKAVVDRVEAGQPLPPVAPAGQPAVVRPEVVEQVAELKRRNQPIQAIRLLRQHTRMGLAEAKRYVDRL